MNFICNCGAFFLRHLIMKINTRHIRKDGYDIPLNSGEAWLTEILKNLFDKEVLKLDSIKGNVHLENLTDTIHLSGHIEFIYHPLCARCGAELKRHEKIALNANLIPRDAMTGEEVPTKEEEIELTADDLDFAFYDNEEIEVDQIVNDEIALALPYNVYCESEASCQARHEEQMHAHTAGSVDPRWLALKDVKMKN